MAKDSVGFEGPLFTNFPEASKDLCNLILDDIAAQAAVRVADQLYEPNHGFVTGNMKRSIQGRMVRDLFFRVDGLHNRSKELPYLGVQERRLKMFANTKAELQRKPQWVDNIVKSYFTEEFG